MYSSDSGLAVEAGRELREHGSQLAARGDGIDPRHEQIRLARRRPRES